ncbi:MAG: hypothetical protein Ct9H300mP5_4540 [Candidatus Pelagibacterales bacterium]|nr:MAG: hypothetical protein Ct9H300mP5_4540 [Pelagibacterales bacterium]
MQKKIEYQYQKTKKGGSPFSVDDNIFHTSTEGKVLESPKKTGTRIYLPENYFSGKKHRIKIFM